MLKLKAAFFLSVLALAACSGSKSGSTNDSKPDEPRTEIEVKYNLPPAPDAELAKTEIVDTNNDGLRDEVERGIALSLDEEGEDVVALVKEAATLDQSAMEDYDNKDLLIRSNHKQSIVIACLMEKYDYDLEKVTEILNATDVLLADTEERQNQNEAVQESLSGGVYFSPSDEEIEKHCPQYFQ